MNVRFYLLPVEIYEWPPEDPTPYMRLKYLKGRWNPDGLDALWSAKYYWAMPVALVAVGAETADHDFLAAQTDLVAVPQNVNQNISEMTLPRVKEALEDLRIPAGWVTTSHTYGDVLRATAHLFMFAQRYQRRHARKMIEAGYNLDTLIGDLPADVRANLNDTAQDCGWNTNAIQGSWPLRQALRHLAQQWGEAPVKFGSLAVL